MLHALRWFVSGFLATLIFHQPALWLLKIAGITSHGPYSMKPVPPLGVPAVISLAFWGGVWGILMMFALRRVTRSRYWITAIVFGAILPTLVAWFVVAPIKHQPMAGGGKPSAIVTGLVVNAAWGLGTAFFARIMSRRSMR